jgi:wyosine [tRNA(Phe)-imidazoG37] synthetase (radical SAM superfamily)
VIPSLDAGCREIFRRVNRPHPDLDFAKILSGIASFRQEFEGQIWLEVFLLKDLTDDVAHVRRMAGLAKILEPDRVQLNTVIRPPAEKYALAVDSTTLRSLAAIFGGRAEVISDHPDLEHEAADEASEAVVMGLLRRRPCTTQDVSHGLGIPAAEATKRLEILERDGKIVIRRRAGKVFYVPSRSRNRSREG